MTVIFFRMFDLDKKNLATSIREFFQTGHTVIDLLNHVLEDRLLLEEYLAQHQIPVNSTKLPGIIIQVYLLTSKLFNFDVYGVLNGSISETLGGIGKSRYILLERKMNIQSDAEIRDVFLIVISLEEVPSFSISEKVNFYSNFLL